MDLGEKIGAETQKLSGLLEEAEQTARQVYKVSAGQTANTDRCGTTIGRRGAEAERKRSSG